MVGDFFVYFPMLIRIHPQNPQEKLIDQCVDLLQRGEILIIPTDSVYAYACDSGNIKSVEQVCKLKKVEIDKFHLSFLFKDLSSISEYVKHYDTWIYKIMKKALPGPYTFILNAGAGIPNRFFGAKVKKKTLGIRIPDCKITSLIIEKLGRPLVATSLHDNEDEIAEYITDPELIEERYQYKVAAVIDGGMGNNIASTVIDCTGHEALIIREGKGSLDIL